MILNLIFRKSFDLAREKKNSDNKALHEDLCFKARLYTLRALRCMCNCKAGLMTLLDFYSSVMNPVIHDKPADKSRERDLLNMGYIVLCLNSDVLFTTEVEAIKTELNLETLQFLAPLMGIKLNDQFMLAIFLSYRVTKVVESSDV